MLLHGRLHPLDHSSLYRDRNELFEADLTELAPSDFQCSKGSAKANFSLALNLVFAFIMMKFAIAIRQWFHITKRCDVLVAAVFV